MKTWQKIMGGAASLALMAGTASADVYCTGFEAAEGWVLGSVDGQDAGAFGLTGWILGAGGNSDTMDQEVTATDATTLGGQSWRISNSGTTGNPHGSFSMPYSPSLIEGGGQIGDPNVVYDSMIVSFAFKSATTVADPSHINVDFSGSSDASAAAGSGDRNSILVIDNRDPAGIALTSFDKTAAPTTFASGLSRTDWHTIDIVATFGISPLLGGPTGTDFQYFLNGAVLPTHADDGFGTEFRNDNGFVNDGNIRILFHTRFGSGIDGSAGFYFDDIFYGTPADAANPCAVVAGDDDDDDAGDDDDDAGDDDDDDGGGPE